ncbi:hypothetical protein CEXT_438241 [Caerostris extrusa]|uniref:Uncharacterized protein n=1 Tax=Caerostris extrusa TaxID=172846 RepID=A0AAV4TE29_CAEEX|nr:hypothetical protein CEXT_438241 [Caerostris extrusa]
MPSKSLNFKNNVDVLEGNINVYTFDLKSSDIITTSESFNLQPFFVYNMPELNECNRNSTADRKDIVYAVKEHLQSIDVVDKALKGSVELNEYLKERTNISRNSPIDECHDSSSFGTFLEFTSNDKMREERNYSKSLFENVMLKDCNYNTGNTFLLEPASKVVVEESQETNLFGADCKFLSESGSIKDDGNTDSSTFICNELQNIGMADLVYENPNSIIRSNNDLKFGDFNGNESLLKSPEVHESEKEIFANKTHYLNENFTIEETYLDLSLQFAKTRIGRFQK